MEEKRANGAEIGRWRYQRYQSRPDGDRWQASATLSSGVPSVRYCGAGRRYCNAAACLVRCCFSSCLTRCVWRPACYGVAYGYRKGVDIVKDMGGGFPQKLTEGGVNPRPVYRGGHWLTSGRML